MFWILVLAHLTADYPLQTDRLVLAKKRLPGLLLHVSIHLAVMLLLFILVLGIAWPYLVAVAVFHFFIDAFKNYLSSARPHWIIGPYIFDQVLHFSSLILVSIWIDQSTELLVWPVIAPWSVYLSGLLTATYVWFVSERILVYKSDNRQIAVSSTMWPRMGVRFLLYVLMVAPLSFSWILGLVALVIVAFLYRRYNYLRSWFIIDSGLPIVVALTARLILMIG